MMSTLLFRACLFSRNFNQGFVSRPLSRSLLRLNVKKFSTYVDLIVKDLPDATRKSVGRWLAVLSGMTFGAVVLGGITRLTESGLSMVDWHLFKEVPPLTEDSWKAEFEKYKQFPEYEHVVRERGEMSLSRFKFIWHMEYGHRQWGRLLGLAYALPAVYFWRKGYFSRRMKPRVLAYGLLIGFQGLFGWYMVKSGLDRPKPPVGADPNEDFIGVPRVSHYRLATHLGAATILYTLLLWTSFSHLAHHPSIPKFDGWKRLKILTHSTKAVTFVTLIFGAFVAGLDAGLVYNSWPKMGDRWTPDDLITPRYGSAVRNLVENPAAVQYMHRMLAYTTIGLACTTWGFTMTAGRRLTGPHIRNAAHMMLAATFCQSAVGVLTLINYVPVCLGTIHQGGSLILFTSLLWLSHSLRAIPK